MVLVVVEDIIFEEIMFFWIEYLLLMIKLTEFYVKVIFPSYFYNFVYLLGFYDPTIYFFLNSKDLYRDLDF